MILYVIRTFLRFNFKKSIWRNWLPLCLSLF